jgi:hypothetical protein
VFAEQSTSVIHAESEMNILESPNPSKKNRVAILAATEKEKKVPAINHEKVEYELFHLCGIACINFLAIDRRYPPFILCSCVYSNPGLLEE